jgi:4'-phosphopantetheinyl transferase EntD
VLDRIVPEGVIVVTTREDRTVPLFPDEEQFVRTAVESRQREFATGRACARDALTLIGRSPVAILPGDRGEPRWPGGVVGSITHCRGYRAAAVGDSAAFAAIGIDAEPHTRLRPGVLSIIASGSEVAWVRDRLRDSPGIAWDRLLFCMKEAAYKAWAPLVKRRFALQDLAVSMGPLDQGFTARLRNQDFAKAGWASVAGKWLVSDDLMVAAAIETAEQLKTQPFT